MKVSWLWFRLHAGVVGATILRAPPSKKVPDYYQAAVVDGGNPSPCDFGGFLSNCDAHLERVHLVPMKTERPGPGAALVKVAAGSVNAKDWEDLVTFRDDRRKLFGIDLSGTVEAVGDSCGFQPGDEVWGTGPGNTHAEYAVVPCVMLGRKPANLTHVEAAGLPIVALTALGGLKQAGAPWSSGAGPTVVVLGGAGGSGMAGIQMAKAFGASKVITTCSPSHFELVKSLGADEAIDYHASNWWELIPKHSVDVVYDCAPHRGTGEHVYQVLRDGGTYVTLLPMSLAGLGTVFSRPSVKQLFYLNVLDKSTRDLDFLRQLVERGQLKPAVDSVYNLSNIGEALAHSIGRHASGKIIIRM